MQFLFLVWRKRKKGDIRGWGKVMILVGVGSRMDQRRQCMARFFRTWERGFFFLGGTEFSGIGRPLGRLERISGDDKHEGRLLALQVVFSGLLDQPLDRQYFLASSIFTGVSFLHVTRTGHHGNFNIPRLEYQIQLRSDSADSLGSGVRVDEVTRYVLRTGC